MIIQPLLDKLTQLHLTAFHDGVQEQLKNPQYAELSFEERLALLVDQECTRRHERRIRHRVKQANFPQAATLEDFEPLRYTWVGPALYPGTGPVFLDCASSQHAGAWPNRLWKNFPQLCPGRIRMPK